MNSTNTGVSTRCTMNISGRANVCQQYYTAQEHITDEVIRGDVYRAWTLLMRIAFLVIQQIGWSTGVGQIN